MKVKCNKCGYVDDENKFPKGNDFFQKTYIAKCPKCENRQLPGDASIRMFGGERSFSYVRESEPAIKDGKIQDALPIVLHRAGEAS